MLIRILDIIGSLVGLVLASPLILGAIVATLIESGRPVIFVQERIGRNNAPFRIYKFRTMHVGTPQVAKDQLAGEMKSHVTRVGTVLRRTSIDELPQLVNVLKGDMSLVGPRPALYNQYELIKLRTDAGVHVMRPGLTGLAQIMGREDMSLSQKVTYDMELLKRYSIATYISLILRTFVVLLEPRGTF